MYMNYSFLLFFLTSIFSFGALAQNDGWRLIETKNEIQILDRVDETGKKWIRFVTIVPSSLLEVASFTTEINKLPEWVYACKETEVFSDDEDETLYYSVTDMPFPMSDRYALIRKTKDGSPYGEFFRTESVNYKELSIDSDLVRVENFKAIWLFEKVGENQTKISYDLYTDADIPDWLQDKVKKIGPYYTLVNLRDKFILED